ncbi:chitinase domain-containing protein 1 [Nasonia vitripennis]|uniref:Chitinase domain-containing protein 1 n=1 Tax=Nasonia vitripennis TaxID=7425 RepID=A0A7M7G750_NASVI|nr:chitinase domain-containing protein 1 [Nasonia vitripennis]
MNIKIVVCCLVLIFAEANGTLSPTKGKKAKKQDKDVKKTGPTDKDVFQRNLVRTDPKVQDILRESGLYGRQTDVKHFISGDVLGYITPWNNDGYENAKRFHGKLDMVSPVWLTVNSKDPFKIPTHDLQKLWLHDMKAADNENHTTKILPRILFEGWSGDDVLELFNNIQKRDKLIRVLTDLTEAYLFDGYVLEIWNQFAFSGAKKKLIISIINSIADGLRKKGLDTVLAVPPLRGMDKELFTKKNFDSLAPHIRYFSLMTYDFSSVQRPGPNAPTEWIRKCIEYLVPDENDPKRAQILMGLNFYGYHYTHTGGGPIVGSQYVKLLEDFKGKIQWDDKSQEHFFELKSNDGGFVFYPTLYSILVRLDLAAELKTGVSIWELGQGLNYFFDTL